MGGVPASLAAADTVALGARGRIEVVGDGDGDGETCSSAASALPLVAPAGSIFGTALSRPALAPGLAFGRVLTDFASVLAGAVAARAAVGASAEGLRVEGFLSLMSIRSGVCSSRGTRMSSDPRAMQIKNPRTGFAVVLRFNSVSLRLCDIAGAVIAGTTGSRGLGLGDLVEAKGAAPGISRACRMPGFDRHHPEGQRLVIDEAWRKWMDWSSSRTGRAQGVLSVVEERY